MVDQDLQNKLFVKFSWEIGEDHGGPRSSNQTICEVLWGDRRGPWWTKIFKTSCLSSLGRKLFEGLEGFRIFLHDL